MGDLDEIHKRLRAATFVEIGATLARCVALKPLIAGGEPNFLHTSAKPNRFNPEGVHCIYFAEDERTARAEYSRRLVAACQPLATFFADVRLSRVLDLNDAKTRAALGLKSADLSARWVRSKILIRTQRIGLALSQQNDISGIRFPSDAAREAGFNGVNIVIFPNAVRKPDFVRIVGPTQAPLQQLF
jgi:RES domain-containing protein